MCAAAAEKKNQWARKGGGQQRIIDCETPVHVPSIEFHRLFPSAPPPSVHSSIRFLTTSLSLLPVAVRHHLNHLHLHLLPPRLHQLPLHPPTTTAQLAIPSLSFVSHIHNVGSSPPFGWCPFRWPSSIGLFVTVDSPDNICFRKQGCCLHYRCRCSGCWSRWDILLVAVGRV